MRLYFLDTLRGIAIILMIIFHIFVTINIFNSNSYNLNSTPLYEIGFISRNTLILLFGISLYLSYINSNNIIEYRKKQIKRIKILLICSIIITIATYIFIPDKYIVFGILHFFAISGLILYNFVNNIPILLLIFLFVLVFNTFFYNESKQSYFTGMFTPFYKNTIDHFFIFKYINLIIIGIFIGHILYNNYKKHKNKFNKQNNIINKIGKNTLLIYMIHIPILYYIVYNYYK
tara:strand:+ start:2923 stop:3618 length:696 start_codon:yes stop_codon:yes gene_type:complete